MLTNSLLIIARNKKKKMFESINPYHIYLITTSKEIHNKKKYIVRIWYNGDWIKKKPKENQYNQ